MDGRRSADEILFTVSSNGQCRVPSEYRAVQWSDDGRQSACNMNDNNRRNRIDERSSLSSFCLYILLLVYLQ